MANITKPAVERHSCDIKGCDSLAENPLYWNVSFPIIAQDNYDDGSYFGGTRTRIINPVTIGVRAIDGLTFAVMSDGSWRKWSNDDKTDDTFKFEMKHNGQKWEIMNYEPVED